MNLYLYMIAFLLADAPAPSSTELGLWIACANIVLTFVIGGIVVVKMLRNDSERREVTINPAACSKQELTAHIATNLAEHNHLHTKIGSSERATRDKMERHLEELRAERRADMNLLNQQIREISTTCGALSSSNDTQNQRLLQIDSKLDRLIENKDR
jgi:hypothetical protein